MRNAGRALAQATHRSRRPRGPRYIDPGDARGYPQRLSAGEGVTVGFTQGAGRRGDGRRLRHRPRDGGGARARRRARGGRRPRRGRDGGGRGSDPVARRRRARGAHRCHRPRVGPGARRARLRRVRPGPRALQQRGSRALGRARDGDTPGLAVGTRREPLGCRPRARGVPAAHDRAEGARPRGQHGVHGRARRDARARHLQHVEVRGRRPLGDAREGPQIPPDRRFRAVSDGRLHQDPRERAEPPRAPLERSPLPDRAGRADGPVARARDSGRDGSPGDLPERALRDHPRRGARAPSPAIRADGAGDPPAEALTTIPARWVQTPADLGRAAERLAGSAELGLDVLLERYLGARLPPSRQKDDWSARPLTAAQLEYAAADVTHLLELKVRLVAELERCGRLAWVEEECAALAAQAVAERVEDPLAFARLRGARELSPRGLAVLRELYELRERLARAYDRPPFKILSEETLVRLAGAAPGDPQALAQVSGCTPKVIARWGDAILETVARSLARPDDELPRIEPRPRPRIPAAVERRLERLKQWRGEAAPRFGLEPGLLLPNRLITAIALAGPRDVGDLVRVDGVRRWRAETFGGEIVAALGPA